MPIENKRTPRGAIEIKKDTALGVLTSSRTACISSTPAVLYIITHSVYIINAKGVVYHPPENEYISLSGEYIIRPLRSASRERD